MQKRPVIEMVGLGPSDHKYKYKYNVQKRPVVKMVGLGPFNVERICSGASQICHQRPGKDDECDYFWW